MLWKHKQILCSCFTCICVKVLREVSLRKEHIPSGRKKQHHPKLLEQEPGKVKISTLPCPLEVAQHCLKVELLLLAELLAAHPKEVLQETGT